jgi:hypothetical protein
MKWDEFRALLVGIGPETPLGRIVAIRSEDDKEILKHFTPDQKRIRNEWQQKRAKSKSVNDTQKFLEAMKNAFIQMAGGVKN